MIELMAVIAGILFALGYFIGRMRNETQAMEREISELEKLSEQYKPTLRECNDAINRINAAGLQ